MARRKQTAAEFIEENALLVPGILGDMVERLGHAAKSGPRQSGRCETVTSTRLSPMWSRWGSRSTFRCRSGVRSFVRSPSERVIAWIPNYLTMTNATRPSFYT